MLLGNILKLKLIALNYFYYQQTNYKLDLNLFLNLFQNSNYKNLAWKTKNYINSIRFRIVKSNFTIKTGNFFNYISPEN